MVLAIFTRQTEHPKSYLENVVMWSNLLQAKIFLLGPRWMTTYVYLSGKSQLQGRMPT